MIKKWTCPYCGGKTIPISLEEVEEHVLKDILRELKDKEYPVIVKCIMCGRICVDEL